MPPYTVMVFVPLPPIECARPAGHGDGVRAGAADNVFVPPVAVNTIRTRAADHRVGPAVGGEIVRDVGAVAALHDDDGDQ